MTLQYSINVGSEERCMHNCPQRRCHKQPVSTPRACFQSSWRASKTSSRGWSAPPCQLGGHYANSAGALTCFSVQASPGSSRRAH